MSELQVGYLALHPNPALNFTLNRLVLTIPADELKRVAAPISTLEDWIREMRGAAERAEQDDRPVVAARYYQAAEFYMAQGEAGKEEIYSRSLELMNQAMPEMARGRDNVPYEGGHLPVIRIPATGVERDVLIIHSGFDGLIEEMYPLLPAMASAGYTVIAFEGPGQGAALRESGLHMPFDWEKPVSAVITHFGLETCTLIGMSLGGYLAARAAAFDKRVRRVVSWGAMFDFYAVYRKRLGPVKFGLLTTLLNLGARGVVNAMISKGAEQDETLRWASNHGMHVSGTKTPYDFFQWVRTLNLRDSAHLIDQDALLVMGAEDHLVPSDQLYVQASAMTGARSVTSVMMTAADHAAAHCQVGNSMLVVQQILSWLEFLERRDA